MAASFQTPVLFTLAPDLSRMTLDVNVDEADIGRVRAGQEAAFTVDAYANRTFTSYVVDVRSTSKTVSGVVTYETVLTVDNSESLLRPGMTATAAITVTQLTDALLVPNAALRFTPPEESPQTATAERRGLIGTLMPRPLRSAAARSADGGRAKGLQRVWVLRENEPVAVEVTVGTTGGVMTEIVAGDVAAGTTVLVDVLTSG